MFHKTTLIFSSYGVGGLSNRSKTRFLYATLFVVGILAISVVPTQATINYGRWRDINPTQYSGDLTGPLRGVYVRNGGSGGIGAGDGWAVGGSSAPIIAHYDGFSWVIMSSPIANALYNSANFCTTPGAPGVGLCSPNGDGSDGWIVGTAAGRGSYCIGTARIPHP